MQKDNKAKYPREDLSRLDRPLLFLSPTFSRRCTKPNYVLPGNARSSFRKPMILRRSRCCLLFIPIYEQGGETSIASREPRAFCNFEVYDRASWFINTILQDVRGLLEWPFLLIELETAKWIHYSRLTFGYWALLSFINVAGGFCYLKTLMMFFQTLFVWFRSFFPKLYCVTNCKTKNRLGKLEKLMYFSSFWQESDKF